MPPHPTPYLRRDVFERFGLFDASYRIAADYDAVLRYLGKGGIKLAYILEVLVRMRVGGASNRSPKQLILKSREDYRAMETAGRWHRDTHDEEPFETRPIREKGISLQMSKRALITGMTGQDGSYLAEFLLAKGYEVHGIKRRASSFNTQRIDHIYQDPHEPNPKLRLHYGDLTDASNLTRIMRDVEPDEVYNLGAQCHVAVSFEAPEYTADVDGIGTLRLLEAIRFLGLRRRLAFIRRRRQSSMVLCGRLKKKRRPSILARPMGWPNSTLIGSRSTTGKPMGSMPAMAYSSITRARAGGRPS